MMFQVAFHISQRRGASFVIRAFGRTRAQAVARFGRRLNACGGACEMACGVLCCGSKLYASVTHNGAACERVRIERFKGVKTLSVIDGNYWAYRARNIQMDCQGRHYDAACERPARAPRQVIPMKSNKIGARVIPMAFGALEIGALAPAINDNIEQFGVNDGKTTHLLWSGLLRYAA